LNTNIRPEIIAHLEKDKILSFLIQNCNITIHKKPLNVFDDLIRSIVSQQLSTKAADTIYRRFMASFEGDTNWPYPVLDRSPDQLRALGLSYQKASYIHNVTQFFIERNHFGTDWSSWSDDEIIHELTQIKGVGMWTVEMILMFSLLREDVLPLDDLIIRNNMISLYQVSSKKKQQKDDLTSIALAWRPYRSYACRYLWAAKDSFLLRTK
jgi:DNA-3-methyladenine glycosylase II